MGEGWVVDAVVDTAASFVVGGVTGVVSDGVAACGAVVSDGTVSVEVGETDTGDAVSSSDVPDPQALASSAKMSKPNKIPMRFKYSPPFWIASLPPSFRCHRVFP